MPASLAGHPPVSTDEAIFENVIHTNLNAAFFTVNPAAPLLNDNGSIIFNGSVHNYLGQPLVAAYAATKGGLVSMARSIAADLAPRNIPRERRRSGRDQDSHLEARTARFYICRRVRQVKEVLLARWTIPLGRWASRKTLPKPCSSLASDHLIC